MVSQGTLLELYKKGEEFRGLSALYQEAEQAIDQYPGIFDSRLMRGADRLHANCSESFLLSRPHFHVKMILLSQFSLQRKIEESLQTQEIQPPFFLKLFRAAPFRICIACTALSSRDIHKEQILNAFQILMPSIQEVPGSFYTWQHPELAYSFYYFEVQKLRGKDPSSKDLREFERRLLSQILAISPLTPTVFWPYNKEDSFRQLQFLQRQMESKEDLPQVSVQFQEQTPHSLNFLIHLVRPAGEETLENSLKNLPDSFSLFYQYYKSSQNPFPLEIGVFSIQIPSFTFEVRESINLLYARRYCIKHLERAIGPFRDTNGGLFEIQQQHFETIRAALSQKISSFELFAEKVFYALHPIETWLSLSLTDVEEFFAAFSELFEDPMPEGSKIKKRAFSIFKYGKSQQEKILPKWKQKISHAQITFGETHFVCLIGSELDQEAPIPKVACPHKTLHLCFQEGAPPSLNPHYSSADMRCKILSHLLFEGLTRLNETKEPELGGAEHYELSPDLCTYTFKLRPTYWSNGEKVSAYDYVTSWQSALTDLTTHPEHLFIIRGAKLFKETRQDLGVKALDPSTLRIELEQPDPYFLHKLAQPHFFPLFGSMREPKWFNGPYLVREINKKGLILDKNAYFRKAAQIPFTQIDFRWESSTDAIFQLFQKGELDWIGDPLTFLSLDQIKTLEQEERLKTKSVQRRFFLYFNTQHPILSSASIRKALSLAIDREAICHSFFPHSIPLTPERANPEEARRLLAKGMEELKLETFPSLTFHYSMQTRRGLLATYLQSAWKEVLGISIGIEGEEWNRFRSRIEERNFEICFTMQDTVRENTIDYYRRYEGSNSWNFAQWHNSEYAAAFEAQNLEKMKQILEQEVPCAPICNYTHLFAHHPKIEKLWIDEEGCMGFV